jgi:hypothetical protein
LAEQRNSAIGGGSTKVLLSGFCQFFTIRLDEYCNARRGKVVQDRFTAGLIPNSSPTWKLTSPPMD